MLNQGDLGRIYYNLLKNRKRKKTSRKSLLLVFIIVVSMAVILPVSGMNIPGICNNSLLSWNVSSVDDIIGSSLADKFTSSVNYPEEQILKQIPAFMNDYETNVRMAYNPAQDIMLSTNGSGVYSIRCKDGLLCLNLTGIGRTGNLISPDPGDLEIQGNILMSVHDDFIEWYLNRDEGIEHGVTIMSSPEGKGNLLILHEISGTFMPSLQGRKIFLSGGNDSLFTYSGLYARDSTGRSLNATLDLSGNTILWIIEDGNAVYPVTIDPLVEQYKILNATEKSADSNFGYSVSISGDYTIIGAPCADSGGFSDAGEAYIFHRNNSDENKWDEISVLRASDRIPNANFGYSVSISGDYAASGAYRADSGALPQAGKVYLFYRNKDGPDNWGQIAILKASDMDTGSQFGYSLDISGDDIIVGAIYADPGGVSNAGQAYIFSRNQGGSDNWGEVAILNASDKSLDSSLGASVSISGNYAIAGAPLAKPDGIESIGQAYIFSRNRGGSDNWGEVAILNASDKSSDSHFGSAVSIYGANAIAGARYADPGGVLNAGQAYIFSRNHSGFDKWGEVAILNASDKSSDSRFGSSVSIFDNMAISGAPYSASAGLSRAGQAYLFFKNQDGDDNWGELEIVNASVSAKDDLFASSVCISADYILAGARDADVYGFADAGRAYLSIINNPLFLGIIPETGRNDNNYLPVTITGDNFFGETVVKLKKGGEFDITAIGTNTLESDSINCTFDLTGASPGSWNLEITNPDGRGVTGENAFMITAPPVADTPTSNADFSSSQEGLNVDTGVGASHNLKSGETVSYKFSKGDISKISFRVVRDLEKVMITVKSRNSLISEINAPDCPVYNYEEGEVYFADESDISNITYHFSVPRDWLSSGGHSKEAITMIHYDGERWNDLPTFFTGEDGSCYYYSAEVPDFMLSAISISEKGMPVSEKESFAPDTIRPEETSTPVITERKTESAFFVSETPRGEPGGSFSSLQGIALFSIVMTGVIGAGIWHRIRRSRYPDWWFEEFDRNFDKKR